MPCLTGSDIIVKFNEKFNYLDTASLALKYDNGDQNTNREREIVSIKSKDRRHRAHLLKIDVEGSSVSVLRSLLALKLDATGKLPLMIQVEVKTAKSKSLDNECVFTSHFLEAK